MKERERVETGDRYRDRQRHVIKETKMHIGVVGTLFLSFFTCTPRSSLFVVVFNRDLFMSFHS